MDNPYTSPPILPAEPAGTGLNPSRARRVSFWTFLFSAVNLVMVSKVLALGLREAREGCGNTLGLALTYCAMAWCIGLVCCRAGLTSWREDRLFPWWLLLAFPILGALTILGWWGGQGFSR